MNKTILGTCAICGGPVTVPQAWLSVVPPVPCCDQCGARAKAHYGPAIEMTPVATPRVTNSRE